eukprot:gene24099-9672_t
MKNNANNIRIIDHARRTTTNMTIISHINRIMTKTHINIIKTRANISTINMTNLSIIHIMTSTNLNTINHFKTYPNINTTTTIAIKNPSRNFDHSMTKTYITTMDHSILSMNHRILSMTNTPIRWNNHTRNTPLTNHIITTSASSTIINIACAKNQIVRVIIIVRQI